MAELKYDTVYVVPPYSAWRISFPSHSKTYLVFGSKEDAVNQATKIKNKFKKTGINLQRPSIREISKSLRGYIS